MARLGATKKTVERRKKVMRLRFVKRWPVEQIAQVMEVSTRTIERDLQAIREYNNSRAMDELKQPAEQIIWETTLNYHERQMLRWQEFSNCKDTGVRNRILRDIQQDEESYYKFLQSLGILERVPERLIQEITGKDGGPIEVTSPRDEIASRIASIAARTRENKDIK